MKSHSTMLIQFHWVMVIVSHIAIIEISVDVVIVGGTTGRMFLRRYVLFQMEGQYSTGKRRQSALCVMKTVLGHL